MTQKEAIKRHLVAGRTITPLEAIHEYGTIRLGAYIHLLRKEGMNIRTNMVRSFNGKTYAEYSLVKEGTQASA